MRIQPQSVLGEMFADPFVLTRFNSADTTLTERVDIGCLLVSSAVDSDKVSARLNVAAQCLFPLEGGRVTEAHPYRVFWLTPRSWLVHCSFDEEWALANRINEAFPDKLVHASLYTDHLCWLELSGRHALTLLTDGGFVSLERDGIRVGCAKRTLLAGVGVVIYRKHLQTWLLAVERSRTNYIASWLQDVSKRGSRGVSEDPASWQRLGESATNNCDGDA
jgi:heterotetrameric sarcosine oxidase gamma subunit